MPDLGAYLKAKRTVAGLTQAELARRAGVAKSHLSNIEANKTDVSLTVLGALARVFGLGAGDLLVEAGYTTIASIEEVERHRPAPLETRTVTIRYQIVGWGEPSRIRDSDVDDEATR